MFIKSPYIMIFVERLTGSSIKQWGILMNCEDYQFDG
jgi:hypothetical protein